MDQRVSQWLDQTLAQEIPPDVAAFCFNLYQDGPEQWSMELVGAGSFDLEDSDWPCDEVTDFGTRDTPFAWSSASTWEQVLGEMVDILVEYLQSGPYAHVLKDRSGVGVGFVDGDLDILYHA